MKSFTSIAVEFRTIGERILGAVPSPSMVVRAATEASRFAQQEIERHQDAKPPGSDIDCRIGCSYCCHMRTLASPAEVLLLAEHLRENWSKDALAQLERRLADTSRRTSGMSDTEHGNANIPCSLLVDDKCSVYEVRPLECRGYTSFNVDACRSAYEDYEQWNVPLDYDRYSIFKNVQAGLLMAMAGSGLDHQILELNTGLHIALSADDAIDRWLAGEDVFGSSELAADDPARLALQPWTPTFFAGLE